MKETIQIIYKLQRKRSLPLHWCLKLCTGVLISP